MPETATRHNNKHRTSTMTSSIPTTVIARSLGATSDFIRAKKDPSPESCCPKSVPIPEVSSSEVSASETEPERLQSLAVNSTMRSRSDDEEDSVATDVAVITPVSKKPKLSPAMLQDLETKHEHRPESQALKDLLSRMEAKIQKAACVELVLLNKAKSVREQRARLTHRYQDLSRQMPKLGDNKNFEPA